MKIFIYKCILFDIQNIHIFIISLYRYYRLSNKLAKYKWKLEYLQPISQIEYSKMNAWL